MGTRERHRWSEVPEDPRPDPRRQMRELRAGVARRVSEDLQPLVGKPADYSEFEAHLLAQGGFLDDYKGVQKGQLSFVVGRQCGKTASFVAMYGMGADALSERLLGPKWACARCGLTRFAAKRPPDDPWTYEGEWDEARTVFKLKLVECRFSHMPFIHRIVRDLPTCDEALVAEVMVA